MKSKCSGGSTSITTSTDSEQTLSEHANENHDRKATITPAEHINVGYNRSFGTQKECKRQVGLVIDTPTKPCNTIKMPAGHQGNIQVGYINGPKPIRRTKGISQTYYTVQ